MTDAATSGTVRLHRILAAPPERVYRAFTEAGDRSSAVIRVYTVAEDGTIQDAGY